MQVHFLQPDGQLLTPGAGASEERAGTGEIVVSGPMLALGYRCDPQATAHAFTVHGYRTGDIGTWTPAQVLQVQGRSDDVIAVRGTNVALGAVEAVLSGLPAIAAVAAIPSGPIDDPAITVCLVLAKDDEPALSGEGIDGVNNVNEAEISALVRAQVREHLGSAASPARIVIVGQLPTLPGGKIDRVRLRRELAGDQ